MNTDLHLTDSQLESLAETHTGLHALVVAWRGAAPEPWVAGVIGHKIHTRRTEHYGQGTQVAVEVSKPNINAIVQTRNKIELAAAEAYWRDGSRWAFNSAELDMALDERHKYAEQKLAAIRAALKEGE